MAPQGLSLSSPLHAPIRGLVYRRCAVDRVHCIRFHTHDRRLGHLAYSVAGGRLRCQLDAERHLVRSVSQGGPLALLPVSSVSARDPRGRGVFGA